MPQNVIDFFYRFFFLLYLHYNMNVTLKDETEFNFSDSVLFPEMLVEILKLEIISSQANQCFFLRCA